MAYKAFGNLIMIYYADLTTNYKNRFDLAKFMDFSNDSFDPLTSYFLYQLKNLPSRGNRTITIEEFNPEFLSFRIYGDPQYDWILMEFNNLTSIFELVNGMEINYPSVSELEELYYNLESKQQTANTQTVKPVNTLISLDSELSVIGNNPIIVLDSNFEYDFIDQETVIVNHTLNKRPAVHAYEYDEEENEISIPIAYALPKNFETKRVIVYFDRPRTGKIVLN